MPPLTRTSTVESSGAPDGSEVQTQENTVAARATPPDFATDPPFNLEALVSPVSAIRGRLVICLIISCLCLSVGAATFTVIVLESSQIRLPSITFGGFHAVFLAMFSVSFITDVCATVVTISRIFGVGLTDNQLACWDTYHGVTMNIVDHVVPPVIFLNVINACFRYHGGQDVLDCITHVITIVFFLVWASLLFSGDQHASAESIELESSTRRSSSDDYANAGEVDSLQLVGDSLYTPSSPRNCDAAEMAASALAPDYGGFT